MTTHRLFPVLMAALFCLVLFPGLVRSQMPQAPGRLYVTSTPAGASVAVDNRRMSRQTPFTFVVSPGNHTVKVNGDGLSCSASLNVPSSSTKSLHCTAKGWDPPVK
jgi:hypothetical protein